MRRALAAVVAAAVVLAGVCLAQAPRTDVESHIGQGVKLMQEQLFEAAANEFEKALALDKADLRARFQYAVCLITLGRNDEARQQFEEVRKYVGASAESRESRFVTYYLGRLDLLASDYPSAIRKLGSVAEDAPFPDTAFHLGVAYISAGDLANGTKWLESAAKLTPGDYRVHYRLARAYSSAGREQDADREFSLYSHFQDEHKNTEKRARACTDALRTQPRTAAREICYHMFDPNDPEKLTLLGQLFGEGGAYNLALDPLQRAVSLDPNSFEAWHDLGLTYFRLQRYAEARAPLEKAVALRPEFYGSVVLLGGTLYMLGDDGAALPVLERAHRLNPADAQTADVLEKLRAARRKK
jgi:Flp pilus assembly protein TadD